MYHSKSHQGNQADGDVQRDKAEKSFSVKEVKQQIAREVVETSKAFLDVALSNWLLLTCFKHVALVTHGSQFQST